MLVILLALVLCGHALTDAESTWNDDRLSLVQLAKGLNVSGWIYSFDGWNQPWTNPCCYRNDTPCVPWAFVGCFLGRVTVLYFYWPSYPRATAPPTSGMVLGPTTAWPLPFLTELNTQNIRVAGPVPDGSAFPRLKRLLLGPGLTGDFPALPTSIESVWIYVTGSLPANFGSLPLLRECLVWGVTGPIPDGEYPSMALLSMQGRLSGTIPAVLMSIPVLRLDGNDLTGTIPAPVTPGAACWLSSNRLVGTIPPGLLAVLDLRLDNNALTGTIPDTPCNNCSLTREIRLSWNRLNGTIPSSAVAPDRLTARGNQLTGTLPAGFFSNPTLRHVDLQDNLLSGSIPPFVLPAREDILLEIFLSGNRLTGQLPEVPGRTVGTFLGARNSFTGSIPCSLLNLTVVDVTGNNLTQIMCEGMRSYVKTLLAPFNNITHCAMPDPETVLAILTNVDLSNNPLQFMTRTRMPARRINLSNTRLTFDSLPSVISDGTLAIELANIDGLPFRGRSLLEALHWLGFEDGTTYLLLSMLRLSRVGLTGPWDADLRSMPNLRFLDLSHNDLTGTFDSRLSPPALYMRLSYNEFTGLLPDMLAESLGAKIDFFAIDNNPRLRSSSGTAVPSYLVPVVSEVFDNVTGLFSCYGVTDARTRSATVVVDPSFLSFGLCSCRNDYVGVPVVGCSPVTSLCEDGTTTCATSAGGIVAVATGFWPSPSQNDMKALLSCALDMDGASPCNPFADITCRPVSGASATLACSGMQCAPGHTGRLCAQCEAGFFNEDDACFPCPSGTEWRIPFLVLIVVTVALVLLIAITRPQSSEGDAGACCKRVNLLWSAVALSLVEVVLTIVASLMGLFSVADGVLVCGLFVFGTMFIVAQTRASSAPADVPSERHPLIGASEPVPATTPVSRAAATTKALLKTLLVYTQTLAAIGTETTLWPSFVKQALVVLAQTNVRFAGLSCITIFDSTIGYEGQLYLVTGLVPGLVFILLFEAGCVTATLWCRARASKNDLGSQVNQDDAPSETRRTRLNAVAKRVWRTSKGMMIFVLYCFVYTIFQHLLAVFNCVQDPTPGSDATYLDDAVWILCGSSEHVRMEIMSGVAFAGYVVVLVLIAYRLFTFRARLAGDAAVRDTYGILYSSYKPAYWWFEGVVLLRRLALSASLALIPTRSPFQPLVVGIVLLGALLAQAALMPNQDGTTNAFETLSLAWTLATHIATMVVVAASSTQTLAVAGLVFGANALLVVGIVVAVTVTWGRALWPRCMGCLRKSKP